MIIQEINGIPYRLKTPHDLSFVGRYGTAFQVIDQTGSGCICFGVQDNERRYFIKVAGADTAEAECSPESAVDTLKNAVSIYTDLAHPDLIRLTDHFEHDGMYTAVFEWAEGDGLFDHWNFDKYESEGIKPPNQRFRELPSDKRLSAALHILSFYENAAEHGYIGCDFYDGSLIYDFERDRLTICDIDLFRKAPVINELGADYWGTKRLKAPEEYIKGAVIDQSTNVFGLGALFFDFFGEFTDEDIQKRYENSVFLPCTPDKWSLSEGLYNVLVKATSLRREKRYITMTEFAEAFRSEYRHMT